MTDFELQKTNVTIEYTDKKATAQFSNLDLDHEHPLSPEVSVTFEKEPLPPLEEGKVYGQGTATIDAETPLMQELSRQAEALRALPELERLRPLYTILSSHFSYASHAAVDALGETDPGRAEWVRSHVSLDGRSVNIPLSQVIEHGYGICQHFAIMYLWLAQKADLRGIFIHVLAGWLRNIMRSDTGQPLFKTEFEEGEAPAHAFVEIQLSDGRWIPIDPTVNLFGDTTEGLSMFRDANYRESGAFSRVQKAEPNDLLYVQETTELEFLPGEARATARYALKPKSFIRRISREGIIPGDQTPYRGDGTLIIQTASNPSQMGLKIVDVRAVETPDDSA